MGHLQGSHFQTLKDSAVFVSCEGITTIILSGSLIYVHTLIKELENETWTV